MNDQQQIIVDKLAAIFGESLRRRIKINGTSLRYVDLHFSGVTLLRVDRVCYECDMLWLVTSVMIKQDLEPPIPEFVRQDRAALIIYSPRFKNQVNQSINIQ